MDSRGRATGTRLPDFAITPASLEKILALGGTLYLGTEPGGYCGSAYVSSVEPPSRGDRLDRFEAEGAVLVMAPETTELLTGAKLDYSDRIRPPRFRVLKNPNIPDVCPCKRSFGQLWPAAGQKTCRSYLPMQWDEEYEPPQPWQRQTGWLRGK